MNQTIAIITLITTIVAAAAAIGSWKAAAKANESAARMAALEQDRRHGELTPTFQITCAEKPNCTGLYADLHVRLTDGGLERLDEMTVTILDDTSQDHWAHGLPKNVTQEQAEAFVWGPWEFNTGASEQVISNRTSRPRPYSLVSGKDWDLLSLHRTSPGSWMKITPEQWKRENPGPLHLRLTCRRDGYEPWTLRPDVTVEPEGLLPANGRT